MNIPTAGTWYLWVRMYGPTTASDAMYESINGATRALITAPATAQWQWVAGRSYTLAVCDAKKRCCANGADGGSTFDEATFVPTEQAVGDQTPPAGDTGLTAVGATSQVTLSWTNSSSVDFTQSIVRYRTDGKFPVSPVDGFPVVTKTGSSGAADGFVHTGLTNGTTYSYSVFAQDGSGNFGPAAKASATATDVTAPAAVQNLRRSDKH